MKAYIDGGKEVSCYFCGKKIMADDTGERLDNGGWYNINSGACGEYVCEHCDTDENLRYDEDTDMFFDKWHERFAKLKVLEPAVH